MYCQSWIYNHLGYDLWWWLLSIIPNAAFCSGGLLMYLTITIKHVPQCLSVEKFEFSAADRFRCAILENFISAVSFFIRFKWQKSRYLSLDQSVGWEVWPQCFAVYAIEEWNLLSHTLNLSWPCPRAFLCPREHCPGITVPWRSPGWRTQWRERPNYAVSPSWAQSQPSASQIQLHDWVQERYQKKYIVNLQNCET